MLANDSLLVWTGGTITPGAGDRASTNPTASLQNNGTQLIEGTGTLAGSGGLLVNGGLVSQVAGLGATAIG